MDERAVRELRALAEQDRELEQRAAHMRELDNAITLIRTRAEAIGSLLERAPEQQLARANALAEAEADRERRLAEVADAERELATARDEEGQEAARRRVARANDHVSVATTKVERAEALRAELERDLGAVPAELTTLYRRAADAGEPLGVLPAGDDAAALVEWASHAHAEVFVAASQLDARRERLIREVNELASMVLGEPTYGSTPAQVLARLDAST